VNNLGLLYRAQNRCAPAAGPKPTHLLRFSAGQPLRIGRLAMFHDPICLLPFCGDTLVNMANREE
jgi:hypothetical protein